MILYTGIDEIGKIEDDTVVALGTFDGIHKGHQELIRRAVRDADAAGMKCAVFTFSNHPRNVIPGRQPVKNILTFREKTEILERLGVDILVSVDFTPEIRDMKAEVFIDHVLLEKLNMKEAYCGFNFRFGAGGKGDPKLLMSRGVQRGFGLHMLEPFSVRGKVVSSSLIRECIKDGNVEACSEYLGRPYHMGGKVIVGNRIGRTIGFPTMNIAVDETMAVPANGVYVTRCRFEGISYPAVTNVGYKPTIGSDVRTIETHLLDFSGDGYGEEIDVTFLKQLRPEYKFESKEALARQIQRDCQHAREYHAKAEK